MKKIYFLLVIALLASCNTLKRAEKSLNSGDYNQAFDILASRYQKGLSDKKYAEYMPLLQQTWQRLVNQEEEQIERLRDANNPAYFSEIYIRLVQLNQRQQKLKALLPVRLNGQTVNFTTKNYNSAIETAKSEYSEFLYNEGLRKMAQNNKSEIRDAYYNFKKVSELIPGYGDVNSLIQQARFRGTEFILVDIENRSNLMIPRRFEEELLNIRTQDLDEFWLEFHNQKQSQINYDYLVQMDISRILVSPERMNAVRHRLEKEIEDGWEYVYENGQQVTDSLGNPVKTTRYIHVRADVEETFQEKDAMVEGRVNLIRLADNQVLDYERLHSEFGFRNHFARFQGDRRALDSYFMQLAHNRAVPFPSHEQMVYDCAEDLKMQLRTLIKRRF